MISPEHQTHKLSLVMGNAHQVTTMFFEVLSCAPNNFSILDCSKLELNLYQLSAGPTYEMRSNMTRPLIANVSAVTVVRNDYSFL